MKVVGAGVISSAGGMKGITPGISSLINSRFTISTTSISISISTSISSTISTPLTHQQPPMLPDPAAASAPQQSTAFFYKQFGSDCRLLHRFIVVFFGVHVQLRSVVVSVLMVRLLSPSLLMLAKQDAWECLALLLFSGNLLSSSSACFLHGFERSHSTVAVVCCCGFGPVLVKGLRTTKHLSC